MKKYLFFFTIFLVMLTVLTSCFLSSKQNPNETRDVEDVVDSIAIESEVDPSEMEDKVNRRMLKIILEQLNLKQEDCYSRFISSKVVPTHEQLTIWVIPRTTFYEKDEYGNEAFNVQNYVLLADTETGKVVSKYYSPYELSSDAYELMGVSIDTIDSQLNMAKTIFGVSWGYRASTRVCPTGNGVMELFVQQGDSLQPIFKFTTYDYHGENDGGFRGNSWMGSYRTDIIVLDKIVSGYSDIALLTTCATEVYENGEEIENRIENDSVQFFSYAQGGYKEVENYTDVFCLPSVEEKFNCIYFNKTLSEVYKIIYDENRNGLQRYMRAELPTENLEYDVEGEDGDRINVLYNYTDQKQLDISFGTEGWGQYYRFEDKGSRIIFKYDYHD